MISPDGEKEKNCTCVPPVLKSIHPRRLRLPLLLLKM